MSLTEGKNILVYVETAGDTPVGPALEILAKAKELPAPPSPRWCWQQRPRRAKMLLRWLHRNSMQDVPLMS